MALDERTNITEHVDLPNEAGEQLENQAAVEYAGPIEQPNFVKLHDELKNNTASIDQVELIPQTTETQVPVEYEPKYTSENFGSKEKAHEALVLEQLINHGVKEEDASDEMERVLGLAADLKE